MKNIKFLWIIIGAAVIGSCNKTLDPTVYSSLTNTNAFSTVADAMAAVNAVYARLKGPAVGDNYDYWTVRHFALTDLTTDVGHCSYGGDPGTIISCAMELKQRPAGGRLAADLQADCRCQ